MPEPTPRAARTDVRVPFGLAVAMAGQDVGLVDGVLDEYEAAHRAEVLNEAADALEAQSCPCGCRRAVEFLRHLATEAVPAVDPHAGDEQVRCTTPHCPSPEVWFAEAAQRGWVAGPMGTWRCPEHAVTEAQAKEAAATNARRQSLWSAVTKQILDEEKADRA